MTFRLGKHADIAIGRPQAYNFTLIHAGWFVTFQCIQIDAALFGFCVTVEIWRNL